MGTHHASCHCGNVELEFDTPTTVVTLCHCQNCRNLNGSDYSCWIHVPASQLRIIKGELDLVSYEISELSYIQFCRRCGTKVCGSNGKYFQNHRAVPLGVVKDYSAELMPQFQVFTNFAAEWHVPADAPPIKDVN